MEGPGYDSVLKPREDESDFGLTVLLTKCQSELFNDKIFSDRGR